MNTLYKVYIITFVVILNGCSQKCVLPAEDTSPQITFQVEKINSDQGFVTSTKSISLKSKTSGWRLDTEGKIYLTREVMYDLLLENGEEIEFGIWFTKQENDLNLLILENEDQNFWERNWDYVSIEEEAINFYQGFDESRIMINNNVIFHQQVNDNFNIISVESVEVDGQEKSLLTLSFSGEAFGYYDPKGEYQEVYKILNGVFKGVIE